MRRNPRFRTITNHQQAFALVELLACPFCWQPVGQGSPRFSTTVENGERILEGQCYHHLYSSRHCEAAEETLVVPERVYRKMRRQNGGDGNGAETRRRAK